MHVIYNKIYTMKYDCFTFFNELDLLEIRLNILNDVVDKFVLVEATRTQNNQEKILYYQENKERYKNFQDKIIHIIVDDYPEDITRWTIENYQRNCISRGLRDCKTEDIIIISDLDEIPNPKILEQISVTEGITAFDLNCFYYYINNLSFGQPWEHGPKMLTYKNFKNLLDDEECDHGALDASQNEGTTASKIRLYSGPKQKHILNAGWHFGYLGGEKNVLNKLHSICEGSTAVTIETVKSIINTNKFGNLRLIPVIIDDTYPEYLINMISKYQNLILPKAKYNAKRILYFHFIYMKWYKIFARILKNFHPIRLRKRKMV